jgi:hypothetical protein
MGIETPNEIYFSFKIVGSYTFEILPNRSLPVISLGTHTGKGSTLAHGFAKLFTHTPLLILERSHFCSYATSFFFVAILFSLSKLFEQGIKFPCPQFVDLAVEGRNFGLIYYGFWLCFRFWAWTWNCAGFGVLAPTGTHAALLTAAPVIIWRLFGLLPRRALAGEVGVDSRDRRTFEWGALLD